MKHVLIVDDVEQLLLTIRAGFAAHKDRFEIITARKGYEAMTFLAATQINLVVTDIKMPEMDGFELLALLKNHFPEIPAIVMTASGTPEMEARLEKISIIKMLEKPVDFDVLTQLILSVVEKKFPEGMFTDISLPKGDSQILQISN